MEEREDRLPPTAAPDPVSPSSAVSAEDFGGPGRLGLAPDGVQQGFAQDVSDRVIPHDLDPAYELSAVDERPEILNRSEFARRMRRNYPPLLRDAGVTGTVQVRFRVLANGQVGERDIAVTNSTHEQFNAPSSASIRSLRFRPAMLAGEPVQAWMELPVNWTTE